MEKVKELTKYFDIVGNTFSFEENSSIRLNSIVGGIISFLVILTTVILAFLFGSEVYERNTPSVMSQENFLPESRIYLKDLPFIITFIWENGTNVKYPDEYFDYTVEIFNFDVNYYVTEDTSQSIVDCNYKNFEGINQEYVKGVTSNPEIGFKCLSFNNNTYFQNANSNANSQMIKIQIYQCNNNTRTCPENLDLLLKEIYVMTRFINTYIESTNYTNPVQYYDNIYSQQVGNVLLKRNYFSFTNNVYNSDNGWMLQDIQTINYISLQKVVPDVNFPDSIDTIGEIYCIVIDSPSIILISDRSYMKIQELIAKVGGLIKGLMIIVEILFSHFLRFEYLFYVATSKFNSKEDSNSKSQDGKSDMIFSEASIDNLTKDHNKLIKNTQEISQSNINKGGSIGVINKANLNKIQTIHDVLKSNHIEIENHKNNNYIGNENNDNKIEKSFKYPGNFNPSLTYNKAIQNPEGLSYVDYLYSILSCNKSKKAKYLKVEKYSIWRLSFQRYLNNSCQTLRN